jgi:hypothetical protein
LAAASYGSRHRFVEFSMVRRCAVLGLSTRVERAAERLSYRRLNLCWHWRRRARSSSGHVVVSTGEKSRVRASRSNHPYSSPSSGHGADHPTVVVSAGRYIPPEMGYGCHLLMTPVRKRLSGRALPHGQVLRARMRSRGAASRCTSTPTKPAV